MTIILIPIKVICNVLSKNELFRPPAVLPPGGANTNIFCLKLFLHHTYSVRPGFRNKRFLKIVILASYTPFTRLSA